MAFGNIFIIQDRHNIQFLRICEHFKQKIKKCMEKKNKYNDFVSDH